MECGENITTSHDTYYLLFLCKTTHFTATGVLQGHCSLPRCQAPAGYIFVSLVPEQPFPQTEVCTTVRYIAELSRTSNLFNNLHLTQQSSFLLQHFDPNSTILFSSATFQSSDQNVAEEKRIVESNEDC